MMLCLFLFAPMPRGAFTGFQTVSSFYGFSPEVFSTQSASVFVYLHFAPFSEPHQAVISVLGAKVIPGTTVRDSRYSLKK